MLRVGGEDMTYKQRKHTAQQAVELAAQMCVAHERGEPINGEACERLSLLVKQMADHLEEVEDGLMEASLSMGRAVDA